ncbi:GIY-YIG nuclease family protein [Microbacterium jejuense]|uniref:GIY-YIG nuclease family protein n=1 Tax=Microbacterium jejuense TaxID=1263637 RepID=UPI0031EA26F5
MSDWRTSEPEPNFDPNSAAPTGQASDAPHAETEFADVDGGTDIEERPLEPLDEIRQLLFEDQSRLGDVYRLHVVDGHSPQEVADRLNIGTPNFVYSYRAYVDAILSGKVSSGAQLRRQTASALRSLIRRNRSALSTEALRILNANLALAEQPTVSDEALDEAPSEAVQDEETRAVTDALERTPGIYAFSYGWYLENPVDNKANTLIKIGKSENVGERIRQHRVGARAHIPEPLVVVRVYGIGDRDLDQTERDFHRLLSTAGHDNPRRIVAQRSEVGKEWFLTNEAFLDAIASALGLRTEYIGRSEFVE